MNTRWDGRGRTNNALLCDLRGLRSGSALCNPFRTLSIPTLLALPAYIASPLPPPRPYLLKISLAKQAKKLILYKVMQTHSRITVNRKQCGGRPCIRGMRIRVSDVLDLLQSGLSPAQIVSELPDLEMEDIIASISYAKSRIDHPVLVA